MQGFDIVGYFVAQLRNHNFIVRCRPTVRKCGPFSLGNFSKLVPLRDEVKAGHGAKQSERHQKHEPRRIGARN